VIDRDASSELCRRMLGHSSTQGTNRDMATSSITKVALDADHGTTQSTEPIAPE